MSLLSETSDTAKVAKGIAPSFDQEAVWVAAQETIKATVPTLNDMLGKVVTLNTALIGGGVVVLRVDALPLWAGTIALLWLFASLACALYGLWPRKRFINPEDLEALEVARTELIYRKSDVLTGAGICLGLGMACVVTGAIWKGAMVALQSGTANG